MDEVRRNGAKIHVRGIKVGFFAVWCG